MTDEWECFSDPAYYDMWCIHQVGSRTFGEGFHLVNGDEAKMLCRFLNTRPADRIEAQAAEIDRLREAGNDLGFYAGHEDACDCVKGWAKGPCNCGYTEAWQAWHSLAGKAEQ